MNYKLRLENVATVIDTLCLDLLRLMDGEKQPTGESSGTWDCANKDLHAILFKTTIKSRGVAAMIVRKYKDETKCSGAGGHQKCAWDTLVEKYRFEPNGIIRDMIDELRNIKMMTSQDPDEFLLRPEKLHSDFVVYNNMWATDGIRT